MDWIQACQEVKEKWDLEPDWALIEYQKLFAPGPVLDLGMGNGRNTLFFAKLGYEVDCVDVSKTWVKKCQNRANAENLQVSVQRADLRSYDIPKRRYSLIITSKVLQFFLKSEIEILADKIVNGLAKRGCVYLRVFSPDEYEHYVAHKQEVQKIEPNTYFVPRYKLHYHFFTKEEVLDLFSKLKVLHCVKGMESSLQFKKPRKEWVIEYIGQRMR
jgi:SAM-dependent methyltransferase